MARVREETGVGPPGDLRFPIGTIRIDGLLAGKRTDILIHTDFETFAVLVDFHGHINQIKECPATTCSEQPVHVIMYMHMFCACYFVVSFSL